jgi:CRP-like cAMP-binding protein
MQLKLPSTRCRELKDGTGWIRRREERVPVPDNSVHVELRRHDWAKELSEEALTAILKTGEQVHFHAGQVVIEVDSEINHVYFLITGRMQATLYESLGKELQKDILVPGFPVGLFSVGLTDRSHMHVQAIEASTAIRLTLSQLLHVMAAHPDFQLAMFRTAANIHKR